MTRCAKRMLACCAISVALFGCSRNPSVLLDNAGPHAAWTADLFWSFLAVCAVVWLAVMAMLAWVLRRRDGVNQAVLPDPMLPTPALERRLKIWVGSAVAATVAILTVLVGVSYAIDSKLIALDRDPELEIQVIGHQWWWELRYSGAEPGDSFTTANELHVPVGRKIALTMTSNDVIHSLWLPNFAGKRDIIPGRTERLVIRPDREGTWYGRCAEFCGQQHAYMGITLVAQSPQDFAAWSAAQSQPAAPPADKEAERGQQLFTNGPCGLCHVVRGTDAAGHSGMAPDLTHLKSRKMLAGGVAPNAKGYLGGWIIDPHGLKPGVHMPPMLHSPDDFQALLAFLEGLK